MRVKVKFFAALREITGRNEETLKLKGESHLKDLIELLQKQYRTNLTNCLILINGRNAIHLNGPKTKLMDGDTISIIPPSGGG